MCGDGKVIAGEACDDGNTTAGDGCSATCAVEDNWRCDGNAPSECDKLSVAGGCSSTGGSGGLVTGLFAMMFLLAPATARRCGRRVRRARRAGRIG